ncbi:MAG: MerR family transcriptional regulator [Candidatus Accumulibacter sp.]|jgi:DNA-binding transcriptional MerR regulator|nr:MerR family transcriptional regulator [Accumulibacter sp.]
MTIAEVAEKYGLTTDTLRYYERIGLLAPVPRTKGGNRDYGEMDLRAVDFIKCMRSAGVAVEALVEYVALFQEGDSAREARKEILTEQRKLLVTRIAELQKALDKLDFKIANYDTAVFEAEKKLKDTKEK